MVINTTFIKQNAVLINHIQVAHTQCWAQGPKANGGQILTFTEAAAEILGLWAHRFIDSATVRACIRLRRCANK